MDTLIKATVVTMFIAVMMMEISMHAITYDQNGKQIKSIIAAPLSIVWLKSSSMNGAQTCFVILSQRINRCYSLLDSCILINLLKHKSGSF